MVGGFEYTIVGVMGRIWDLGLLAEYHGDDRGRTAPHPFNHDSFFGARTNLAFVRDCLPPILILKTVNLHQESWSCSQ